MKQGFCFGFFPSAFFCYGEVAIFNDKSITQRKDLRFSLSTNMGHVRSSLTRLSVWRKSREVHGVTVDVPRACDMTGWASNSRYFNCWVFLGRRKNIFLLCVSWKLPSLAAMVTILFCCFISSLKKKHNSLLQRLIRLSAFYAVQQRKLLPWKFCSVGRGP